MYQAAVRTTLVPILIQCPATKVTKAYRASKVGVVRAMARSFHCR